MSVRASRWWLWLALALALPVPIWLVGPGWVPAARLLMLGAITVAVMVLESARGAAPLLAVFLIGQGLVYLVLCWLLAGLTARLLAGLSPRSRAAATGLLLVLGLGAAASSEIYETPYAERAARASLLTVFR